MQRIVTDLDALKPSHHAIAEACAAGFSLQLVSRRCVEPRRRRRRPMLSQLLGGRRPVRSSGDGSGRAEEELVPLAGISVQRDGYQSQAA